MPPFKDLFSDALRRLDNRWDKLQQRLLARAGRKGEFPLIIIPYRGFGRTDYLHLQGRVLKHVPLYGTQVNSAMKSLIDSYRRFGSNEITGAYLDVHFGDNTFETVTDEEGYFAIDTPLDKPVTDATAENWEQARLVLKRTPWRELSLEEQADVMIPSAEAAFAVISDIDDTILHTHVTSLLKLKALYHTVFKNAANRRAFQEVAAFYQSLHHPQPGNRAPNPVFYVSNSPWNLYDLLEEFLEINHLPRGPIMLRDIGIPRSRPPADKREHKYDTIVRLLNTYPRLSFVLIGDSGERDADIYLEIARQFPDRIRSIYIRDVRSPRRAERIAQLIRRATNVDIRLVSDYPEAARDGARKGLLQMEDFENWREKLKKEG